MGNYGQLWAIMGNYGQLWAIMGNYGQLWAIMGKYGQGTICQALFRFAEPCEPN